MSTKNKPIARNLTTEKINVRSDDDGRRFIEGYAIIFNQRSKLIREWGETFFEVIEPSAPDNVLRDPGLNTIATVDHWRDKMLGRVKSGTLVLTKDDRGLKYTIEVADTTLGNDMYEMVKRGDYYESSFIFTIAEKGIRTDNSEDIPVKYVSDFAALYDISVVIDGAYANTAVTARAQEWEIEETTTEATRSEREAVEGEEAKRTIANELDILVKELEIIKLKK